jgi:hypothetical protein
MMSVHPVCIGRINAGWTRPDVEKEVEDMDVDALAVLFKGGLQRFTQGRFRPLLSHAVLL